MAGIRKTPVREFRVSWVVEVDYSDWRQGFHVSVKALSGPFSLPRLASWIECLSSQVSLIWGVHYNTESRRLLDQTKVMWSLRVRRSWPSHNPSVSFSWLSVMSGSSPLICWPRKRAWLFNQQMPEPGRTQVFVEFFEACVSFCVQLHGKLYFWIILLPIDLIRILFGTCTILL